MLSPEWYLPVEMLSGWMRIESDFVRKEGYISGLEFHRSIPEGRWRLFWR